MTESEAMLFLREHQTLPPDDELSTELAAQFDAVRKFLIDNPVDAALPLLLTSFGEGSGFELYQIVDEVVAAYPSDLVIQCLQDGLKYPSRSVQYWNADIAARFPDSRLVGPLSILLSSDDLDLRSAAIIALVGIDDSRVDALLQGALQRELDPELQERLTDAIHDRANA